MDDGQDLHTSRSSLMSYCHKTVEASYARQCDRLSLVETILYDTAYCSASHRASRVFLKPQKHETTTRSHWSLNVISRDCANLAECISMRPRSALRPPRQGLSASLYL